MTHASPLARSLELFDADPGAAARQMREIFQDSPADFARQAAEALRSAQDTPATCRLLTALACHDLFAPIVLDPAFPRVQAIALARIMNRLDRAAALNLVQSAGDLSRDASAPPDLALRGLELIGATMELRLATGIISMFLRHESARVRSKAALLLGRAHRNLAWVRQKLSDSDARIRANAVESIWGATGAEATQFFQSAASDPDNRVAGNACLGLYMTGDPAAAEPILHIAASENPRFRATAAWVMGETGSAAFAEALDRLREDPAPSVRFAAVRASARVRRGSVA